MATETEQGERQPAMPNREADFDEVIQPLVRQLVTACQAHGMSVLVGVQFADPGIARTFSMGEWADPRLMMATVILGSAGLGAMVIPIPGGPAGEGGVVN